MRLWQFYLSNFHFKVFFFFCNLDVLENLSMYFYNCRRLKLHFGLNFKNFTFDLREKFAKFTEKSMIFKSQISQNKLYMSSKESFLFSSFSECKAVKPVIFAATRDSKGAQKSEIVLILGHILMFLGSEKFRIPTNLGPCVEV
jgi:hypothetical protein